jgi:hydroxyethylthiazole kinase-like uncharacterized protein yjeF
MCMKIVTSRQMQQLDDMAIETYNIPGINLMEKAGENTVEAIIGKYGDPGGRHITILVGPGNNGGDGLVVARLLHLRGALPEVFLLVEEGRIKGDARTNYTRLQEYPVPISNLPGRHDTTALQKSLGRSWLIVDSLFGTGLARDITGYFADVVTAANAAPCPVVAVDIPSGLCADSGRPLGICVRADLTVTFGLAKIGQVTYPGRKYVGELSIADIGIPAEAIEQLHIKTELLDETLGALLPPRPADAHKGTFGHLLVIAGSVGKTGAAILCAQGGLRSGAGLVTLCVPHDLDTIFEISLWEAMTIPLSSSETFVTEQDYPYIEEALAGKNGVAVGPGLGTAESTSRLVKKLYRQARLPMIVDADGLNILAREPDLLSNPEYPRILTPHPGEMARLLGCSIADVQNNRLQTAQEFAAAHQVYVVLKGAATVVTAPDQRTAINPTGNSGMATGGMGDVLSGIIGGFLSQGLDAWNAACLGVYAHGLAGDRLAGKDSDYAGGFLASELAAELPKALRQLYH